MTDVSADRARADVRLAWIIVGASALLTLTLLVVGGHLLWGKIAGWATEQGRTMQAAGQNANRAREAEQRRAAEAAEPSEESDEPLPIAAGPPPPDTARPIGSPAAWIGADDYPPSALRRGYEGRVRVTVAVDQAGSPTGCSTRLSSGHWALDNATCAAMLNHGRFAPAPGGARVRYWTSPPIRWALPEEPRETAVDSDESGKVAPQELQKK